MLKAKLGTTALQSVTMEFRSVIRLEQTMAAKCSAKLAVRGHCQGKVILADLCPLWLCCPIPAPAVAAGVPAYIKEPSMYTGP